MTNDRRPGSGAAGAGEPPSESDQIIQRRANLDAIRQLGVDVYPRKFTADAGIDAGLTFERVPS